MDTIIAYRVNGGQVQFVLNDDGECAVFAHHDEAVTYALDSALFASGQADYQIITLDEL
jgi:hypothetical protein